VSTQYYRQDSQTCKNMVVHSIHGVVEGLDGYLTNNRNGLTLDSLSDVRNTDTYGYGAGKIDG